MDATSIPVHPAKALRNVQLELVHRSGLLLAVAVLAILALPGPGQQMRIGEPSWLSVFRDIDGADRVEAQLGEIREIFGREARAIEHGVHVAQTAQLSETTALPTDVGCSCEC